MLGKDRAIWISAKDTASCTTLGTTGSSSAPACHWDHVTLQTGIPKATALFILYICWLPFSYNAPFLKSSKPVLRFIVVKPCQYSAHPTHHLDLKSFRFYNIRGEHFIKLVSASRDRSLLVTFGIPDSSICPEGTCIVSL